MSKMPIFLIHDEQNINIRIWFAVAPRFRAKQYRVKSPNPDKPEERKRIR